MRAFLIDPTNQTIQTVDYNGDYRQIYEHIGAETFDAARFNAKGDAAFIDDEGLLKQPEFFFSIQGYGDLPFGHPLAGKGLVLGVDAEGESVSPSVDVDWLWENVHFYRAVGPGVLVAVPAAAFRKPETMQ